MVGKLRQVGGCRRPGLGRGRRRRRRHGRKVVKRNHILADTVALFVSHTVTVSPDTRSQDQNYFCVLRWFHSMNEML